MPGVAADKNGRRNAIDDTGAALNNATSTTAVVAVVNAECNLPCATLTQDGLRAQVLQNVWRVERTVQQRVPLECVNKTPMNPVTEQGSFRVACAIANKRKQLLCASASSNNATSTTTVVAARRAELSLPYKAANQKGGAMQVLLENAVR